MEDIGSLGLCRKQDQSIVIGDPNSELFAIVTVRWFAGNKVWLNVTAPKSLRVMRGELLETEPE